MVFGNQGSQENRAGSTPSATGKPESVQGGLAARICRKQDPYSPPMLIGSKRFFKEGSPHLVSGHQYPKTHELYAKAKNNKHNERKMKHINEASYLSSYTGCCVGSTAGFNYRADSTHGPLMTHKMRA